MRPFQAGEKLHPPKAKEMTNEDVVVLRADSLVSSFLNSEQHVLTDEQKKALDQLTTALDRLHEGRVNV